MAKLIGLKKVKTAIFISGTGSNLESLIKFSLSKNSPIKINLIVSNNSKAKGLELAKIFKIKKKIYNFKNKSVSEKFILKDLKNNEIRLICLAGFMKILSKDFIKRFKGKILNIHPSLLPKYRGLDTHARVINNKEKYSGCTVHYVNSKLDAGRIILQKKVRVSKRDNAESLKIKILKQEHKLYPKAVIKILTNL
ncbi:phosphoribosylglycinamide formyltransferase [Candidatus Pelagibacter sp. HIMB1483]|uniref:phosphoribosylglycinamide formyltransferase n=1 Tax=Candidatus Pelagibacter sp. HIMB1483 TaxID=3415414 RepID=UPI003F85D1A6